MTAADVSATRASAPGVVQGCLLLTGSCLPILGAVLLGPVLPQIQQHYAGLSNLEVLVPATLTLPGLMIALFSPFAGMVTDRFGRKTPLVIAFVAYGIFGTMPLWLTSLHAILASRAGLGIAEAVVMTACTTLISDYFFGAQRAKWLALQTAAAAVAATVFFGVGGALGAHSWKAPFLLYAVGFVLFPLAALLLWEPRVEHDHAAARSNDRLPWRLLSVVFPLAVVAGICVLLIPIQAGFLLQSIGVTAPEVVGLVSAVTQGATLLGALTFRLVMNANVGRIFFAGFLLAGIGAIATGSVASAPALAVSGSIVGFGAGLLLTSLINWAVAALPLPIRGRVSGGFTACVFLGEFLSPLIVFGIRGASGGTLSGAVAGVGIGFVVVAFIAAFAPKLGGIRDHVEPAGGALPG